MPRSTRPPFDLMLPAWGIVALYAAVHLLATLIGTTMQIRAGSSAAFWPASGTLIAFLLLYPHRLWPGLLFVAIATHAAVTLWIVPALPWTRVASLVGTDVLQSLLCAALVQRVVGTAADFTRLRPISVAALLLGAGTFLGGLVGAAVVTEQVLTRSYWLNQQTWWMSGFLGAIILVPLIMLWARAGLWPSPPPDRTALRRAALQFVLLAAIVLYTFSLPIPAVRSLLDSAAAVYPVLLWIALDGGLRRVALALLLTVLATSALTLAGLGPFTRALVPDYEPILRLQGYLALIVAPVLVVHAVTAERRRTVATLGQSEERYRAFIRNSGEAIFRAELVRPMPLDLPEEERRGWIERDLEVAECNDAFRDASGFAIDPAQPVRGCPTPVWLRRSLESAVGAIAADERLRDLEHVLPGPYGLDRTLLVSLTPVIEDRWLVRIWGAARDITHLREAQAELVRHERELRMLATELTLAEERARRHLAVELHDGLAQSLIGMQLHVSTLRQARKGSAEAHDLANLEKAVASAVSQTRSLLTTLLPPGLYDQGLVAGLKWLTQQFAERERVPVQFSDDGATKPLDEPTTVLMFQTARQLLQNVARHARAPTVAVRSGVVDDRIWLEVTDSGVGFDAGSLMFKPGTGGGFGLFSIRERLAMIGGTLDIDSRPGRGTTVRATAPMRLAGSEYRNALGA